LSVEQAVAVVVVVVVSDGWPFVYLNRYFMDKISALSRSISLFLEKVILHILNIEIQQKLWQFFNYTTEAI